MVTNMGALDRTLRILVVLLIGVLWFAGVLHGALAVVLGIVAVAFAATSVLGWCPLYAPFGLSTLRRMSRSA